MKYTQAEVRASYLAFMVGWLSKTVDPKELIAASDAALEHCKEYYPNNPIDEIRTVTEARR